MDLFERQRETAIEENSAQKTIFDVLENLFATDTDIFFKEPLVGDVDLEVLKECNFTNIEKLRFSPGKITSLKNIPTHIKELSCPKNLLNSLENIPETLELLDIEGNGLKTLDVSKVKDLKVLKVSENRLVELENLPLSLEQMFCNNNDLRKLDLDGLTQLGVLHCSGNKSMNIHNLPENIADFNNDNLPTNEISRSKAEEDIPQYDVYESLNKYFMLKTQYETHVKTKKKALYKKINNKARYKKEVVKLKPLCINCKKPVGTIFSNKNRTYKAICGGVNSSKCNLDIKIYMGEYDNLIHSIQICQYAIEENKENIIKMKMDTLLDYVSESKISKDFKNEYDEYNGINMMLTNLKTQYEMLHFSKENDEKQTVKKLAIHKTILHIQELLGEYKKNHQKDILTDVIDIYQKQLMPEVMNLRHLKYSIMNMDEDKDTDQSTLFQSDCYLNEVERNIGEQPQVLKFLGNF